MRQDRSPRQLSTAASLWRAALVFALAAPCLVVGCGRSVTPKETRPAGRGGEPVVFFEDVTQAKGLPAKTPNWPDGTFATPEVTAGGVALFDYDNDGRLDILQVCHGRPGRFDETAPIRLFHQESDGTFRELDHGGGLSAPG